MRIPDVAYLWSWIVHIWWNDTFDRLSIDRPYKDTLYTLLTCNIIFRYRVLILLATLSGSCNPHRLVFEKDGKKVDGEKDKWQPDLNAVKATMDLAIKTGRLQRQI